jgi:hypothetical protein
MSDRYIYSITLETNPLNPTPESKKTFTRSSAGLTPFYTSNGLEIIIWETYFNPFTEENETKWRKRATNNPSGGGFVSLNLVDWYIQPGYVSFAGLVFISLGYRNRNLIKGDGGTGKLIGKSFIRKVILTGGFGGGGGSGLGSLMNGTYIRNKENEDFIQIEHTNYSIVFIDLWYLLENGIEVCVSSDLINWQNSSGEVLTPPIGQIFYKP